MVLADGARADVFEALLAAGELPNIDRHVVQRGAYRCATSTFTSTTGPAHLPLLTGRFPGTANVPGYRWFDRALHRRGLPPGPWCARSYNGPESWLYDRDIDPAATTLFELVEDPVSIFSVITRGVPASGRLWRRRRQALWLWAHYRRDYDCADRAAAAALLEAVRRPSELRFAVFPGIDWHSHFDSPFGAGAEAAYRAVDTAVGAAAEELRRAGTYDDTLIVVCSDHGHTPVREHFDLAVRLEADHGLRVAYHSARMLVRDPAVIVCVSGNGMAHVYVRGPEGWAAPSDRATVDAMAPGVRERLLAEPAVDLLLTREGSHVCVESRRGRARLVEVGGEIDYRVAHGDPFGYGPLPERMDMEQALALTVDSGHPDGLLQAVQLFRSDRCGDVVVSATPGYDLRERYEHPEHLSSHGALHRDHMAVPLAMSAPLQEGPLRTADVFGTVLEWLGRPLPRGLDGVSRLDYGVRTPTERRTSSTAPHSE
jgi:arylsulfatase A-like enzyme